MQTQKKIRGELERKNSQVDGMKSSGGFLVVLIHSVAKAMCFSYLSIQLTGGLAESSCAILPIQDHSP
jgi:hypothetical protein